MKVKVTVSIKEEVLLKAKHRAIDEKKTLSALVESALESHTTEK